MNTNALILDVAHGKDTPGKRSPDGMHREYLWSRERIANALSNVLAYKGSLDYQIFTPFLYSENEPGRTTRVKKYNSIAKDFSNTLVISLHNDAENPNSCDAYGWGKANGAAVWTSKGQDISDEYATDWFYFFKNRYPNQYFRQSTWEDNDPDYEENFTILAGNDNFKPKYHSFLIEWLFQTNRDDVKKLKDPIANTYFQDIFTEYLIQLKL